MKRLEECQYKILAENFITSVQFLNSYTKGLIFLDTDDEAKLVAGEIFEAFRTKTNDLNVYRIQEVPTMLKDIKKEYRFVTNVFVRRWKSLSAIGAEFFPRLCAGNICVYVRYALVLYQLLLIK